MALPAPFVIGARRSGTTLLRMMLDSHPELAIPPETGFIPAAVEGWDRSADPLDAFVDVVVGAVNWPYFGFEREELAAELAQAGVRSPDEALRVFYALCARKAGKPRWGDKTPGYVQLVPLIARHLPEARFVHIVRDGRDVALSHRGLRFGPQTIEDAAYWWSATIRAARDAASALPAGSYLELRFEALVAAPKPELRRICELVELPWSGDLLAYPARSDERLVEQDDAALDRIAGDDEARERILAVRRRLRGPVDSTRAARWRTEMSRAELERFVAIAGEVLAELGYETS